MTARTGVPSDGRITAVLGPTNTGKTHLAVERMLGHKSGIIGLPLRLLAREIYDRIVASRGPRSVALITGEERVVPAHPSYFVCTVEAMPLDRNVEFLAVDEIQLCADPARGHVFTQRLLHARGERETMFLGADSMRGIIRRLLPGVEFISRPRFSELSYAGSRKLSRLPRRSAIVTFSGTELYAIAELVRRQRGGAAVVLGALSPRTRNAQVALYQSGEVDYLVATDAIGMGLNMDVDHVAFASLDKFDGFVRRHLSPAEVAQVAGRAGRHMNDGTFGTTAGAGNLDEAIVEMVTTHRFDPVKRLQWRNDRLDFTSLPALQHSLRATPVEAALVRVRDADDVIALQALARLSEVADRVRGPAALRQLWEICQIPDFAKTSPGSHHRLLARIHDHLTADAGVLPEDWVAAHIERLDRTDGDIDTLAGRIAHVRTWTYVSHRAAWLAQARHRQESARAVEDRLSDALHAALTQRFVDRRTAVLYRGLKERRELFGAVTADGDVLVEGQYVGRLQGLRFRPDAAAAGAEGRALRTAANRVLAREIGKQAVRLADAEDAEISWKDDQRLWWRGAPVARLAAGPDVLKPRVDLLPVDQLAGALRERVRQRLEHWLAAQVAHELAPLLKLGDGALSGAGRGLAYQLTEATGVLSRAKVDGLIADLTAEDRRALRRLGVRLGYLHVFMPALLRPARTLLRCRLWSVHRGDESWPEPPAAGLVSLDSADTDGDDAFLEVCGFARFGRRALRVDMLDRLARLAHRAAASGPFEPGHEMLSLAGCGQEDLDPVLRALGYVPQREGDRRLYRYRRQPVRRQRKKRDGQTPSAHSPFAGLRHLRRRDGPG